MSNEDEVAHLRAETDQTKAAMVETAGGLWSFFSALLAAGFNAQQALTLTSNWMVAMVRNGSGSDGSDDDDE